jgi:hypothetical protein
MLTGGLGAGVGVLEHRAIEQRRRLRRAAERG